MPKYRVTAKSFIGNALVEEGTIVEYDGVPAANLEPLDKDGEAAAEKFKTARAEDIARQKVAAGGGDPEDVAQAAAISQAATAAQDALAANQAANGLV